MSDGGKGSGRRPGKGYQDSWDRIFGNKTCPPCHGNCNQGRACPARTARSQHAVVGAECVESVPKDWPQQNTPP
jgi:hypothetical protein